MSGALASRVIAGAARGTRLVAASGTRPLSDRVKQALFAALEADGRLEGPFLDLFAGSGAGGIEALSRGAPQVTFIERDERACVVIRQNLERAGLAGAWIVRGEVLAHLRSGRPSLSAQFTTCLADPPYDEPTLEPALALLGDSQLGWLAEGALVVGKHFWRTSLPDAVGALRRIRQRRFGETMLSFYERQEGS